MMDIYYCLNINHHSNINSRYSTIINKIVILQYYQYQEYSDINIKC